MRPRFNKIYFGLTAVALLLAPHSARAGYGKRNHVVTFNIGGVLGANEYSEVSGAGGGGGAAYRYYLSDVFSLGADLSLDDYGQHFSDEDQTDVSVRLLTTMLVGRIDFWPRNPWATYFSLGTGSAYVEQKFHEPQGDRTETSGRGAYFLGLGFEAPFTERWMWGGELRTTDPLGVSANTLSVKLSVARRFGKEMTKSKDDLE